MTLKKWPEKLTAPTAFFFTHTGILTTFKQYPIQKKKKKYGKTAHPSLGVRNLLCRKYGKTAHPSLGVRNLLCRFGHNILRACFPNIMEFKTGLNSNLPTLSKIVKKNYGTPNLSFFPISWEPFEHIHTLIPVTCDLVV